MSDIEQPVHFEEASRKKGIFHVLMVSLEYVSVHTLRAIGENIRIMRREGNLFFGAFFFLLGFFNWSSGKYCDGNTADYLSCTRPATYYYYGWFEISLIVLGVSLVLVWLVQNSKKGK